MAERSFRRFWGVCSVALKRLIAYRWLALATVVGLVVVVALTTSIPLYVDAVYYRTLRGKLADEQSGSHPPFAFMFRYVGDWAGNIELEDLQAADEYLSESAAHTLGLPEKFAVRYLETSNFSLFPGAEDTAYARSRSALTQVTFSSASDLQDHIVILEGSFPAAAAPAPTSTVEVLVSESLAVALGLQVGDVYVAYPYTLGQGNQETAAIPVRIAGVWRARDSQEKYWFYDVGSFAETLLVPEESFRDRFSPYVDGEIHLGLWYLVMDGSGVRAHDVGALLEHIATVQQQAAARLPEIRLDVSPAAALQTYQRDINALTFLLYASCTPIVGLVLAFIGLVSELTVERRRNEIAVLRSRGATTLQVVEIALLESVWVGVLGWGIGLLAGELVTDLIGRSRSFLDFTLQSGLHVEITAAAVWSGVAAVALALMVQTASTIGVARHTIVTYKQEQARTVRGPWWQRAWLDALLLIPAAYGVYVLRQQGGVGDTLLLHDPLRNPLFFLIPALAVLALSLFVLRVLPALMSAVAWVLARTGGVGTLLATRHLARSPGFYSVPLLLLILTLSLAVFTASLAGTLDSHLYDQMRYAVGADVSLTEGEVVQRSPFDTRSCLELLEDQEVLWRAAPVSEHLAVPGVEAAARVWRNKISTRLSGGAQEGTFIGIDRVDFARTAFWRRDFAPDSLGALMNALAARPNGVLVPRTFMAQHSLNVGDTFRTRISVCELTQEVDVEIVGGFDMFPTWYPEQDGPLIVGHLDYFLEPLGVQLPYAVWLRIAPNRDYRQVVADLYSRPLGVTQWNASLTMVAAEQERPERQGLFGVLSVGFLAAAVLTVLGFLLYALFSFRRRFIELGILRAIGLSAGQMTVFLAWELAFLIVVGLIAGTGLGLGISRLFIPYLRVGAAPSAQMPPLVVVIAWPVILRIYALFGLLFAIGLAGTAISLSRMEVFQAIRLGETA